MFDVPTTGDYAAALKAIQNPRVQAPTPVRAALKAAFEAMISRDPAAKAKAVQMLVALPPEMQHREVATMLGALGANSAMMQVVANAVAQQRISPASWLYYPIARGVLSDPSFAAFAEKLGLMRYWKTTHTKPDVCSATGAPPFCRMI